MNSTSSSVPLTDVLPWGDEPVCGGRTVLLLDSAETNGRFILHSIASQCLKTKTKAKLKKTLSRPDSSSLSPWNIIWMSCGVYIEDNVRAAMKKIGCDLRKNADRLDFINITHHLVELHTGYNTDSNSDSECLKTIYHQVRDKMSNNNSKCMIILDDVTSLATYFGHTLTYVFLQKIRAMVRRYRRRRSATDSNLDASLIMLASHDQDQEIHMNTSGGQSEQNNVSGGQRSQQIGAEQVMISNAMLESNSHNMNMVHDAELSTECIWERSLTEMADGIIDITPLPSGFARDVHGRLIFTERMGNGLGWRDRKTMVSSSSAGISSTNRGKSGSGSTTRSGAFSTSVVNYCCSDAGVRAIRLRV